MWQGDLDSNQDLVIRSDVVLTSIRGRKSKGELHEGGCDEAFGGT